MNDNDLKTLELLQREGRTSWTRLAEVLGVTGPAAADTVRRLEERGVIRGFAAILSPQAVGLGITAFITTSLERPEQRAAFLKRIADLPQVQECHHMTGDDDYLLKVRCRDVPDLEQLINAEIKSVPGVLRTRTTLVLRTSKESAALPLTERPDARPARAR
jgi:Lrp/AsnC family leucine-responsive transcriptional regulator